MLDKNALKEMVCREIDRPRDELIALGKEIRKFFDQKVHFSPSDR